MVEDPIGERGREFELTSALYHRVRSSDATRKESGFGVVIMV
jgi:hypothetical protein